MRCRKITEFIGGSLYGKSNPGFQKKFNNNVNRNNRTDFFLDAEVDVARDPSRIFHENSQK